MYLRFLHLNVREGQEAAFARFYEESVIPALAATEGCLYAGLLAPWRSIGHQSLTIWSSQDKDAAYQDSGLYDRLLAAAAPMLADRAEWSIRLARDPLETADPSRREPPADDYRVELPAGTAARVALDRLDELVSIYRSEVIPALEEVPGCRGAFLAEATARPMEVLSITLWEREEDSVRYEMSSEFDRLTGRLAGTFAPVFGWETSLTGTASKPEVTSYQLVRGRQLAPLDEEER